MNMTSNSILYKLDVREIVYTDVSTANETHLLFTLYLTTWSICVTQDHKSLTVKNKTVVDVSTSLTKY